jgi:hypothetical protein
MSDRAVRVISLLPAATEIVASLGMLDALLGVSHECDYPEEVSRKPRVTHCEIHGAGLPSAEVDRWVRERLRAAGTLYTMDEDLVHRLRPDAILTQRLCDVCAVNYGSVARFAATLPGPPRVVSLEPSSLADILRDIRTVAEVLGVPERAEAVIASLVGRIEAVRERAGRRPRCSSLPVAVTRSSAQSRTFRSCGRTPASRRFPPRNAARCTWWTARPTSAVPVRGSRTASRSSPRSCTRSASAAGFPTAASYASGEPALLAGERGQARGHVLLMGRHDQGSLLVVEQESTARRRHTCYLSGEMRAGASVARLRISIRL